MSTEVATLEVGSSVEHRAMDIERLMQLAIENDGAIEVFERLAALRNDEMARVAERDFVAAFAEFKRRCPPIPRKTRGSGFKDAEGVRTYVWYADLETIQAIVDPILTELGFHYRWSSEATANSVITICTLKHASGHSESSAMALPVSGPPKSSVTQAHSGTRTFNKRITLSDVLGLATSDDHDGQDGDSYETIDESQVADLEALITEVGADRKRFLKWLGVDELDELSVERFADAVQALETRRA